jgi:archaellum component FlaC
MMDWINKDTLAVLAMVFTIFIGPALAVYLGRFFAKKEALSALEKSFAEYVKKHALDHQDVEARLNAGEKEFAEIRGDLGKLATREDLEDIKDGVAAMSASISGLAEAVKGIRITMDRLNDSVNMLTGHELAEGRMAKAAAKGAQ